MSDAETIGEHGNAQGRDEPANLLEPCSFDWKIDREVFAFERWVMRRHVFREAVEARGYVEIGVHDLSNGKRRDDATESVRDEGETDCQGGEVMIGFKKGGGRCEDHGEDGVDEGTEEESEKDIGMSQE